MIWVVGIVLVVVVAAVVVLGLALFSVSGGHSDSEWRRRHGQERRR